MGYIQIIQGFPGGTSGKESTCQFRRHKIYGFDPWIRGSLGVGSGNLLQYSFLENSWAEEPTRLHSMG